ncbi:hypothetical protein EYF80_028806 [Liparis tanakae]|uniref:Uncharacterized protein n=1 Tax=Liparis tanakae TaxID=230148 RepID=A0A4Z2H592_9TELE|nr:hypothetical protein EYF80_028806 [Liparis tanakae]
MKSICGCRVPVDELSENTEGVKPSTRFPRREPKVTDNREHAILLSARVRFKVRSAGSGRRASRLHQV